MKEIETILATAKCRSELDPIHDKYKKMHFGKKHYADKHKDELDEWKRCNRYCMHGLRMPDVTRKHSPESTPVCSLR